MNQNKIFYYAIIFLFIILNLSESSQAQLVVEPPIQFETILIKNQNIRLAYRETSPVKLFNGKTIVLLHGHYESSKYWIDTMNYLTSEGYRVIAPEHLGFGHSDKPDMEYSFDLLAQVTFELLNKLNVKNFYIVGHSMGGILASKMSLMVPERIKALLLVNPSVLITPSKYYKRWSPKLSKKKEVMTPKENIRYKFRHFFFEWKPEYEIYVLDYLKSYRNISQDKEKKIKQQIFSMIAEQHIHDDLKNLKPNLALIIGVKDNSYELYENLLLNSKDKSYLNDISALCKDFQKWVPKTRIYLVQNSGHTPHVESPIIFKKHLNSFLNSN